MDVAGEDALRGVGEHRAPAVPRRELPRLQPRARREDERRDNLRVLNWVRMVRRHPEWLADDGVHVSAAGYRARAGRSPARCAAVPDGHAPLRDADLERRRRRCGHGGHKRIPHRVVT